MILVKLINITQYYSHTQVFVITTPQSHTLSAILNARLLQMCILVSLPLPFFLHTLNMDVKYSMHSSVFVRSKVKVGSKISHTPLPFSQLSHLICKHRPQLTLVIFTFS